MGELCNRTEKEYKWGLRSSDEVEHGKEHAGHCTWQTHAFYNGKKLKWEQLSKCE